ncbi:MAG TPA: hypothetical protein VIV11_29570 [Kofleriaceae bacterium]
MQIGSCARIAISLVVTLCTVVHAGPKYNRKASTSADPAVVAAEKLWQAAAAEPDQRLASTAWEAASEAFFAIARARKLPQAELADAAFAGLLALKNALNVDPRVRTDPRTSAEDFAKVPTPKPIPPREAKMLEGFVTYLSVDSTSDEAIGVKFLRANILRRWNHFAEATPIYLEILERHRTHEVAEYSANLLLDTYNRQQNYVALVELAERLAADTAFMAAKPDLADTVRKIRITSMRRQAEQLEKRAKEDRDLATYDRCGEAYLAVADQTPGASENDEPLYNALVCFQEGGSVDRARAAAARIEKQHPTSKLRVRALARRGKLEGDVGNYKEAASLLEQYAALFSGEKDAAYALADAMYYRLALGDVVRAEHDLGLLLRTGRPTSTSHANIATDMRMRLVAAHVAQGQRQRAAIIARDINPGRWDRFVEQQTVAGALLLNVSCAVALVDELCPRRRDEVLVGFARRALDPLRATVHADAAKRIVLDLELERVLIGRRATNPDFLADQYRALAKSTDPNVRAAARARLARLALHAKRPAVAVSELDACIAEAQMPWFQICERERAKLEPKPTDRLRERLPKPSAGDAPTATEMLR